MKSEHSGASLPPLLLVPSFWAACTWPIALLAYEARLLRWYPTQLRVELLYWFVWLAFLFSCLLMRGRFRAVAERLAERDRVDRSPVPGDEYDVGRVGVVFVLHVVGLLGIVLYARGLARGLGGWQAFVGALLYAPQYLRWTNAETVGTQLSYFGWIAVGLTVFHVRRRELPRWFWAMAFLQIVANLLFVDRTRPTWIGFTAALVALTTVRNFDWRRVIRIALIAGALFLVAYFGIATFIGKVAGEGDYGRTSLPLPLQAMYVYLTAGFAYFNEIMSRLSPEGFHSGRVLYPMWKLFTRLGFGPEPPSQVNDEYFLPFPVNVGTFMEPWYRDGGVLLLAIGILVQTIVTDLLAAWFLACRRPLAIFAWANLCFTSFIAFFTPKLVTFPIWLFVVLGVFSLAGAQTRVLTSLGVPEREPKGLH